MTLSIGIIGLAQAGKTTVFNALTRSQAQVGYAAGKHANVAVVNVPDDRLTVLDRLFKSKRIVPAQVQYTDIAGGLADQGEKGELGRAILNALQRVDALLLVIRAFTDSSGLAPTPASDLEAVLLELTLADLEIVERRLARLTEQRQKAKLTEGEEREIVVLNQIRQALAAGRPVRDLDLDEADEKVIRNYQFLTARPLLVTLNIAEADLARAEALCADLRPLLPYQKTMVTALCGKLEAEIAQLDPAEAAEFVAGLGIGELGLNRMIQLSYELLGLISFLTSGADETRAWPIRRGSPAIKAAGAVHSDMEKGFIRAEVVSYADLVRYGSMAEAKRHGAVRLEGKEYVVQDGDVIQFLFSPPAHAR